MEKPGESASDLARFFGVAVQEMNRLLKEQGFLYGKPGAYGLTPKGKEFGIHTDHHRGPGGYTSMNRDWTTTHFNPDIKKVLEVTPEKIARVREGLAADRLAASIARKAASGQADAAFLASRSKVEVDAAGVDPRKVLIVAAGAAIVVGGVLIREYGPDLRHKWNETAAPALSRLKKRITRTASDEPDPEADSSAGGGI